jgi:flagellar biosynthesis protein FlhG
MVSLNNPAQQSSGPQIWAIGGGKGGVGKSVVSTAAAMALASQGQRCILVDADLGGANLHTLLGIASPSRTISDLFREPRKKLQEILIETPYENLRLISGARAMVNVANLNYLRKLKLIKQMVSLEADHIFVDLGAGSSFNVLDFFLAAHTGVMVVMPTPTAIENAYHFLRAVYFRKLRRVVKDLKVEGLVDSILAEREKSGIRSPRDLIADLQHRDRTVGEKIQHEMMFFQPHLIINQVQRPEDRNLGKEMALACRDFLGIEITVAGTIRSDERVSRALISRQQVLTTYPNSPFVKDMRRIVQKWV